MKCPLCDTEYACGWWCTKCSLRRSDCEFIHLGRKQLHSEYATLLGILALIGAAFGVGVIIWAMTVLAAVLRIPVGLLGQ